MKPARFGSHRNCGSGDIILLVCHVISQDHMIKGSCVLICRSPLRKVIKFGGYKHCGDGDFMFFICHVLITRLRDERRLNKLSHHPAKSGGHRRCGG